MKKISAIFFALLILALSLKLGVSSHYCGGKIAKQDIYLGFTNEGCGMEEENCFDNSGPFSIDKNPCCKDEIAKISTDNFSLKKITSLSFELASLKFHSLEELSLIKFTVDPFVNYRPPPGFSSVFLPFIKVFLI